MGVGELGRGGGEVVLGNLPAMRSWSASRSAGGAAVLVWFDRRPLHMVARVLYL